MNTMDTVARACRKALTDPRGAAEDFLGELEDPAGSLVLRFIEEPGFAHWTRATVADFERVGLPVLIRGRWGEVWLCPADTSYYQNLEPRAPLVTPRGLRALGRGIVDVLTTNEPLPDELLPWGAST